MSKCIGCGVSIQSEFKDRIGYIPKENSSYCERCFRIIHYNDLKMIDLPTSDIVSEVNKKGKYAFFLVDLLNMNEEVFATFKKIKSHKTLIVSKIDYIPKYIKKDKIKNWLKEEYGILEDILFLSAAKRVNLQCIKKVLESKGIKSAYLLGYTNSGKSTLSNSIREDERVTTSMMPNTTIGYIKIPLEEGYFLIDSPGFQYQNPIYEKKDILLLKKLNPKSFLKPLTYQLKKGTSLIIEDVIRIENKSDKCNLTLYMSNLLDIKKVYDKNLELKDKEKMEVNIKKNEDILIKGLGFINVKTDGILDIYTEKKEWIEVRKSFFER